MRNLEVFDLTQLAKIDGGRAAIAFMSALENNKKGLIVSFSDGWSTAES